MKASNNENVTYAFVRHQILLLEGFTYAFVRKAQFWNKLSREDKCLGQSGSSSSGPDHFRENLG